MAASSKIVFILLTFLFLNKHAKSEKDFGNLFRRRQFQGQHRERRAVTATQNAKDKETNKLVLAALYGGLGQGIQSSTNFDYANGLNQKIQSAGGYGLPPGIYSYAFDPKTGMPFMCDPTKTPPGGSKSQAAGVAAVNPPTAARKPTGDEPVANTPSENELSASAPSPDIHPSASTNAVNPPTSSTTESNNAVPEHRLSPIENTQPSRKAQNYNTISSDSKPTQTHANEKTTPTLGDDIMAPSVPSNKLNAGLVPTPVKSKLRPAVNSKDVHVKLGPPLLISAPKTNAQSSTQNKMNNQRITPLIDNYKQKMQHAVKVVLKAKRSNVLKKYVRRTDTVKKDEIKIKLPEIPPCPDMKNYHWPWNCLEKGNTVKKECIQNYGGTFSFEGATYPYEDYGHNYDYNTDENGNYYVE